MSAASDAGGDSQPPFHPIRQPEIQQDRADAEHGVTGKYDQKERFGHEKHKRSGALNTRGESHMLQVNINRLRRKLEADPVHPRYIQTKVGVDYFLAAHPGSPAGKS